MNLPLTMMTESLSLLDVLTKAACKTEKRLMIDLQTDIYFYQRFDIDDVLFIWSEHDIAKALTNVKSHPALLRTLSSNVLTYPVVQ